MIIATAGHIDHGKTTLVRTLTGLDTDRLPEEKTRGISIDVGFAHMALPEGGTVGFVDVPGHERFIRNMLSGVYAVGHVLLVVAADDGVMPQTREHLHIVNLLGVTSGTVVITKADRVDAGQIELVKAEIDDLLQDVGAGNFPMFAVSAVTMDGMEALRRRLSQVVNEERNAEDIAETHPRFVVDRVFVAQGSGTVVRGTVLSSAIAAGDTLVISPSGRKARVRKLQQHGVSTERARAGERCAINLAGIEHHDVVRGDWLVGEDAHHPTDRIDVRMKVLPSDTGPVRHWTPVHVYVGAADVPARLALRRGAELLPGEEGLVQLRLSRPIQAARGDRLILRDQSATRTLGGGVIVNPFPPQRRAQRLAILEALDQATPVAALHTLLEKSPSGVDLEWFARVHNISVEKAVALLPQNVLQVKASTVMAFSAANIDKLGDRVAARVARFHLDNESAVGIEANSLHMDSAQGLAFDVFLEVARRFAAEWGLELAGSRLRRVGYNSTGNPLDQRYWTQIRPLLDRSGFQVPSARELSDQTRLPLFQIRHLLHRKAEAGELVKLTAERFALPETFDELEEKMLMTAQKTPDGMFKAADFRDVIGTGRTLAIEILECMDRAGLTVRHGNFRSVRGRNRVAEGDFGGEPNEKGAVAG